MKEPNQQDYNEIEVQQTEEDKDPEPEKQEKLEDTESDTLASHTEYLLWHFIAPALLSRWGKVVISILSLVLCSFAAYAWTQVKVDFSLDSYLLDEEALIYDYRSLQKKYYGDAGGISVSLYTL